MGSTLTTAPVLLGCMLLLVCSYMDEKTRRVKIVVPLTLFVASLVFRVVYLTSTLHYWAFFVVSTIILGFAIEFMGGWTRGDTWVFVAAVSALPKFWMYNGVIPVLPVYLAIVMLFNSLLAQLYQHPPGLHSHTATYIILSIHLL